MSSVDLSEVESFITHHGAKCTVTLTRQALDGGALATFDAAVASDLPASAVYQWARTKGYPLAEGAVSRHRRHVCTCHRNA